MSESKHNHAFPTEDYKSEGLSKAEYAAIHLKVPMSGTPWLDEMIEASRRDEFAKASLIGRKMNDIEFGNPDSCYQDADDFLLYLKNPTEWKEGE